MCIRDRGGLACAGVTRHETDLPMPGQSLVKEAVQLRELVPVSYTHLRAHETVLDLVCRLLLEKK